MILWGHPMCEKYGVKSAIFFTHRSGYTMVPCYAPSCADNKIGLAGIYYPLSKKEENFYIISILSPILISPPFIVIALEENATPSPYCL